MSPHKLISTIAPICFALLFFTTNSAHAIDLRQVAPEFSIPGKLKDAKNTIKLSDYRGKLVYLDFWASWCGPCKKSFPWMNAMQEKFASKGLTVIAINLDNKSEDSVTFLEKIPANFLIGFDKQGEIAKQYQVQAMPSSVLIDRDGKILARHKGFNDNTAKKIEEEIEQLLRKNP